MQSVLVIVLYCTQTCQSGGWILLLQRHCKKFMSGAELKWILHTDTTLSWPGCPLEIKSRLKQLTVTTLACPSRTGLSKETWILPTCSDEYSPTTSRSWSSILEGPKPSVLSVSSQALQPADQLLMLSKTTPSSAGISWSTPSRYTFTANSDKWGHHQCSVRVRLGQHTSIFLGRFLHDCSMTSLAP